MLLVCCGCSSSEDESVFSPGRVECSDIFENKGERLLGMDILDQTEKSTFEEDFERVKGIGIDFITLHLPWDQIETTPETYNDPGDAILLLGSFCSDNNIKLALTIRPIDLTGKTVPTDLDSVRFNSELMKSRFKNLIDFVFTEIDYRLLTSLQIGNEIDGFDITSEHPNFWSDYGEFLFDIKTYVSSRYPGLKIGFTVTLLGVTTGEHSTSGVFEALAEVVDVVGVTYYLH